MKKIEKGPGATRAQEQRKWSPAPSEKKRVHFEARKADRIATIIPPSPSGSASEDAAEFVLKAGLAHLWLLTIHPF